MSDNLTRQDDWVPASCTLPSVEVPVRRAEFDDLFTDDVVRVDVISAHELRFELRAEPEVVERAGGLAMRESRCCSFFAFTLTIEEGRVALSVLTTADHAAVLAALAERAVAARGGRR